MLLSFRWMRVSLAAVMNPHLRAVKVVEDINVIQLGVSRFLSCSGHLLRRKSSRVLVFSDPNQRRTTATDQNRRIGLQGACIVVWHFRFSLFMRLFLNQPTG